MIRSMLVGVTLGMAALPAQAQEMAPTAASACPAVPASLPIELAGWQARMPLTAAASQDGLSMAVVTPGKGVDLALKSTPEVTFPVRPEHPGGSVSYGGLVRFTIAEAGTYRVAIGSGAWLDVVADGQSLVSTAHGHGPDCTGVRKMVDFTLKPGTYLLQVSANGAAKLPLMVTRLP